jgi:hypothetical protein
MPGVSKVANQALRTAKLTRPYVTRWHGAFMFAEGCTRPTVQGETATKMAFRGQTQQSFRLQKELIFETMPLTAEAPASRPWWLAYPDYPCTTLVTLARSATRQLGSGQKEQAGEEALHWESSVFGDG